MSKALTVRRALSDYWAGDSHRALMGASSMENRLAIALTPIRSIIRVIDDSRPPMTVDWCKVGNDAKGKPLSMSYTDFSGARIAVNPLPIIENDMPIGQQIDVCSGFAMHEASHAKYSRDRWQYLINIDEDGKETPAFAPMKIAGYLWNLVEDIRIEAATSKRLKGARPYFDNLLDWMWTEITTRGDDEGGLPTEYGPDVEGKMKTVFHACRFPAKARELLPPAMQPEVEWWSAWQQDYLNDVTDTTTTIQRGLDHLAEDPETAAEMAQMAADEAAERERGEKIRAQIERLMKEGIDGVPGVCITEDGEVRPLSKAEADAVNQLVKENLTPVTPIIPHRGASKPSMRVRKPSETSSSRRAYVGKPDAATEAMRSALVFRPEDPEYEIKLQKTGDLDDEELYRFFTGDNRLFSQKMIESKPDTFLGFLVDLSGSMMGGVGDGERSKIETAQRLAQLFIWATHDMEGVTATVWGHTGDSSYGEGSDVFRIWEPGDPMRRLGLIASLDHGNNYDGYAIAYCVDQMRGLEQPQKVLIVLSDGYPAGSNYGGREAEQHMRGVSLWAASQGVTVIQIAIDESLRPADQARMFGEGNWLPYTNEKQLPRDLTRVLARFAK